MVLQGDDHSLTNIAQLHLGEGRLQAGLVKLLVPLRQLVLEPFGVGPTWREVTLDLSERTLTCRGERQQLFAGRAGHVQRGWRRFCGSHGPMICPVFLQTPVAEDLG